MACGNKGVSLSHRIDLDCEFLRYSDPVAAAMGKDTELVATHGKADPREYRIKEIGFEVPGQICLFSGGGSSFQV
jgi:hypothetical protein